MLKDPPRRDRTVTIPEAGTDGRPEAPIGRLFPADPYDYVPAANVLDGVPEGLTIRQLVDQGHMTVEEGAELVAWITPPAAPVPLLPDAEPTLYDLDAQGPDPVDGVAVVSPAFPEPIAPPVTLEVNADGDTQMVQRYQILDDAGDTSRVDWSGESAVAKHLGQLGVAHPLGEEPPFIAGLDELPKVIVPTVSGVLPAPIAAPALTAESPAATTAKPSKAKGKRKAK